MATLDLRTESARREFGLTEPKVSGGYQYIHRQRPYRSRAESMELILDVITTSPHPLTRAMIAHALGVVKSPKIIEMINELVQASLIVKTERLSRNRAIEFVYWIERRHK